MKLHCFQHVDFEGLGCIEPWARSRGDAISFTRFFADEPLPQLHELDWLVILGGPMNIYESDKYPWLTDEKRFIEQAIRSDKIVLGICLGAQLLADVLGTRVFRNRDKEIGWFPIEFTAEARNSSHFDFFPMRQTVFHWHGDTFDLPTGCVRLATSEACENQAFSFHEKVVGLQFHLEVTRQSVERLIQHCGDELVEGTYIQKRDQILARPDDFVQGNQLMHRLLERLGSVENRT